MLFDHRSVQINLLLLITRRFLWRHQALARSSCCLRTVEFDQNSLCNARLCFEAKTDRCRCVNKAGVEASPSPCVSADVLPLVPPVPKRFGGITRMVSAPKKRGPGTALQHQVVQVPLHDHILYALHRLVEEICVGGIREVNVGVLFGISHQIPELGSKKLHSGVDIRVATAVFGEVV